MTPLEQHLKDIRPQAILLALGHVIVSRTSPMGLGRLMKGTAPKDGDEPSVYMALALRQEAGMTSEEYREWLTPLVADALAKHLDAKVTIE